MPETANLPNIDVPSTPDADAIRRRGPTTRELAERVDAVCTDVGEIKSMMASMRDMLLSRPAPPPIVTIDGPPAKDPVEHEKLLDELVPLLDDSDLEKLALRFRGKEGLEKMKALGVIPGEHVIPTINIRATVRGSQFTLKTGVPVLRSDLEPDQLRDLMERRVRAGHGDKPCVLLAEPGTAEAINALQS